MRGDWHDLSLSTICPAVRSLLSRGYTRLPSGDWRRVYTGAVTTSCSARRPRNSSCPPFCFASMRWGAHQRLTHSVAGHFRTASPIVPLWTLIDGPSRRLSRRRCSLEWVYTELGWVCVGAIARSFLFSDYRRAGKCGPVGQLAGGWTSIAAGDNGHISGTRVAIERPPRRSSREQTGHSTQ